MLSMSVICLAYIFGEPNPTSNRIFTRRNFEILHGVQVVYAAQWLPFPMHHSDLVIHAHWADLAEVCAIMRSVWYG